MVVSASEPQFGQLFPKSKAPAAKLHLGDVRREVYDQHFALRVLQGIVARKQPRILLNSAVRDYHQPDRTSAVDLDDGIWIDRLQSKGYEIEKVPKPLDLIEIYRNEIDGCVLYDDRGNHYINMALMFSGLNRAIPCTEYLAKELNLPVVEDIRYRWESQADAYEWALKNIRDRCHPTLLATQPERYFNMMDYLAEFNIFTVHLNNFHSPREREVFREALRSAPPGWPVIGCWDLFYARYTLDAERDYERDFIDLISQEGHYFLVTHDCSNLSLQSGIPPPHANPVSPVEAVQVEEGETCVCFIFSEGDNLTFQTRNRPTIWKDDARGEVPIGWSIAPTLGELFPDAVGYYEGSKSDLDEWIVATSGIGYCMPSRLGTALSEEDQELAWERFCRLTEQACRELAIDVLWILDHRITPGSRRTNLEYVADPQVLRCILERCPSVRSVFCDYPDFFDTRDFLPKQYLLDGVPVIHAQTRFLPDIPLAEQIKQLAREEDSPPFVFVFVSGWSESPSSIKNVMADLGQGFLALSPRDFAVAFAEWAKGKGSAAALLDVVDTGR